MQRIIYKYPLEIGPHNATTWIEVPVSGPQDQLEILHLDDEGVGTQKCTVWISMPALANPQTESLRQIGIRVRWTGVGFEPVQGETYLGTVRKVVNSWAVQVCHYYLLPTEAGHYRERRV